MTHLPYIIPAYTLAIGLPVIFAVNAWMRLRAARVRLAAIDPRQGR